MRVRLPYGARDLQVDFPEHATVLLPAVASALVDPDATIRATVREAFAATAAGGRLRAGGRACIAIPDATRPAVSAWVLPPLAALLREAGVDRIDVVVATGSHRAATKDELRRLVGGAPELATLARSHDAAAGAHDRVGHSSAGSPIWIDRGYLQADFKIAVGAVEPHLMAGFSGGAKTLVPGLAGLETIHAVHRASQADERVGPGIIAGNPFRSEIYEAAALAGVDLSVQVCPTLDGSVAYIAAGALALSVRDATHFAREHAQVWTPDAADVVVTTAAGRPLDRTLYQAAKGWVAALPVVRPGGDVVLVAELAEGIGSPEFKTLLARLAEVGGTASGRDRWMAQHIQQARAVATLHLVSSQPPAQLESCGFRCHPSVESALEQVGVHETGDKTVAVLPWGPFSVAGVGGALRTLAGAWVS